jgi:hypothetical protein
MLCGQGISMNEMPVMMTMMIAKRNNNPTWAGSGYVYRLLPLKMGLYIEKYARPGMGSRWILERAVELGLETELFISGFSAARCLSR